MATIKKPAKKMQTGGKATADSTKFYQDKLKGLATTSPRWSAAANIINSNKKDENFAERQKTKYDLLRQYRKGKSGFDANGNPLKKQKMGGAVKKMQKGGKATKTEYTSEQNAKDWAKKEREMTGPNAPKISSKENNENWAKKERIQTMKKNVGNAIKLLKKGGAVNKMQGGGVMNTKLKDVPGKVKNTVKRAVDKVKNSTIGDAVNVATGGGYSAVKALRNQIGPINDRMPKKKMGGAVKAKNGKSFPDLNKDGKITKADILKGRGVIAKSGAKLKKQAAVAIAMKKAGKAPKKMQYGGEAASMVPPMMKKGGATKKCKYGCK
jgi:hypothetical protein